MEPIPVETGSDDKEGRLVIADDRLVGILVRLIDDHGLWRDHWSPEWVAGLLHHPKPFRNLEAAERWFDERFNEARARSH